MTDQISDVHSAQTLSSSNIRTTADQILHLMQEEFMTRFPAFPQTFAALTFQPLDQLTSCMGTDGSFLFYSPQLLCSDFLHDSAQLQRTYLHIHLHGLLLHTVQTLSCPAELWDEACDLSVSVLTAMLLSEKTDPTLSSLAGNHLDTFLNPSSAVKLLKDNPELRKLANSFSFDTHQFWQRPGQSTPDFSSANCSGSDRSKKRCTSTKHHLETLQKRWSTAREKLQKQLAGSGKNRGHGSGSTVEDADLERRDSMDYHRFLSRFTVPREEAILDIDSFDYIPYYYGLTHYKNMPFLEPLEYMEVNRLDELAIAIDTSGSCSGRIVRRFLEETWSILRQKENFFSKMRLHLIQCDSMIQEHRIFTSAQQWEASLNEIKILGQGNTDFRPVFEYLEKLIAQKEIRHLRGLLYFTDGDGIYPRQQPPFDTAFVFLNRSTEKQKIPDWGIRLNLHLPENF